MSQEIPIRIDRWHYYGMVFSRVFKKFNWGRDVLIATCIALITGLIQVGGGLVPEHKRLFVFSILGPYVAVLILHVTYRITTEPWVLYRELFDLTASLQNELRAKHTREQLHADLGAKLQEGSDLYGKHPTSKAAYDEWVSALWRWVGKTQGALEWFGLLADAALFRTADANAPAFVGSSGDFNHLFVHNNVRLELFLKALREIMERQSVSK